MLVEVKAGIRGGSVEWWVGLLPLPLPLQRPLPTQWPLMLGLDGVGMAMAMGFNEWGWVGEWRCVA